MFRAAVGIFTNVKSLDSPIPIEIFAFGDRRDFERLAPRQAGGIIRPNARSYQVLLGPSRHMSGRVILYHEYVHFLIRNSGSAILPRWYDEGFADFLSTAERVDGRLVVGNPHPLRATVLVRAPAMPVEELIEPGLFAGFDDRQLSRFYARSWLLVHFLSWDYEDPDGLRFSDRFQTYLRARESSAGPREALEQAWGLTPEELDEMLAQTIRTGVKIGGLPLDRLRYSDEVALRPVSREEMARRLGHVALMSRELGLARSLYQEALALDPEDARATAGLADTFKFDGQMEEAEPLFERAMELDPDDVLNVLDRAEYWLDRAGLSQDPQARNDFAQKALEDGRRALQLDPQNPEALWVYGTGHALLTNPDPDESLRALEQAAAILPSERMILYSLLQVYVASGRLTQADRVAQRLIAAAHSKEEIARIESLLQQGPAPQPAEASPPPTAP